MEAVEGAFKEKGLGHVQMPPKPCLFFKGYNGDLRVMPSYLERIGIAAVKVVNSHSNNPSSHGLPTVMATIILVDPRNGAPIAVMGGILHNCYENRGGWWYSCEILGAKGL